MQEIYMEVTLQYMFAIGKMADAQALVDKSTQHVLETVSYIKMKPENEPTN
jgi:hypothetical protein